MGKIFKKESFRENVAVSMLIGGLIICAVGYIAGAIALISLFL